jgi:hypothetical protein
MVEGIDFTHGNINLDKLIEKAFNDNQRKVLFELMQYNRKKFERETCPRINEEISLRTESDGTILGIACRRYDPDRGICSHNNRSCIYQQMINK